MERNPTTKEIAFTKMAGTGNDFILIDNRTGMVNGTPASVIRRLCSRRVSVGADGLLLLEPSDRADFRMRYFNADGGEAEFCGNGARCIALYAYLNGIAGAQMSFESGTGLRRARVEAREVTIDMPEPTMVRLDVDLPEGWPTVHTVTIGVPHVVAFVDTVDDVDVVNRGRMIRHMEQFQPAGTNVNFVQILSSDELAVRTYERGVEDETYSCGTGVCASAIIAHLTGQVSVPVKVRTHRGDILKVTLQSEENNTIGCTLAGEARVVYRGTLFIDLV